MPLQAQLSAQLTAGPASSADNPFPSGVTAFAFGLNPATKQYSVETGGVLLVNSPTIFFPIASVGAAGTVVQVMTLYVRVQSPMMLGLTFADPAGGADIDVVEPLAGIKLAEYPANAYLKALAVKGSGQFEFYALGLQLDRLRSFFHLVSL